MSQAYTIVAGGGIESLTLTDADIGEPGPGQVVVAVHATSLNHRDLSIVRGRVPVAARGPFVPLSDGAGEVVAVGPGVRKWQVGDRVVGAFKPDWIDGPPNAAYSASALGGGEAGMLAAHVVLPADAVVAVPADMSFEQAATLPCAGVTAWNALFGERPLTPGQSVLVMGTGGVSIFALQLARTAGATVIATSSSDAKLERAAELGADHLINYATTPDWATAAAEITGGRGVDVVVEVTGQLQAALNALASNGTVSIIGATLALREPIAEVNPRSLFSKSAVLRGISVGSVAMLARLIAAMEASHISPVIDSVYSFGEARQAYEALAAAQHFGKIVIGSPS